MEGGEIIAVSDAAGFVGAFLSVAEAKSKVLDKFKLIPFLVQRFPLVPLDETTVDSVVAETYLPAASSSTEVPTESPAALPAAPTPLNIWVVPYRDTNAVAFVSNCRSKAVHVQKSLQNVGLTYPDSIDYWMLPLGKVVVAAGERLESITRAHKIYADESLREEEKQKEAAADELIRRVIEDRLDGPLDRLIRENERITLFDCVVDIVNFDPAEDEAAEDEAAEDKVAEDEVAEDEAAEDKATEDKAAEDKAAEDKVVAAD